MCRGCRCREGKICATIDEQPHDITAAVVGGSHQSRVAVDLILCVYIGSKIEQKSDRKVCFADHS